MKKRGEREKVALAGFSFEWIHFRLGNVFKVSCTAYAIDQKLDVDRTSNMSKL
jgi:hypothetical protein